LIWNCVSVRSAFLLLSLMIPPQPRCTLFPYTTLFRSRIEMAGGIGAAHHRADRGADHDIGDDAVGDQRPDDADMGETARGAVVRSEEHTSELQSRENLVCRLLLEKKNRRSLTGEAST